MYEPCNASQGKADQQCAGFNATKRPAMTSTCMLQQWIASCVPEPRHACRVLACSEALEALVALLSWRSEVPRQLLAAHCPTGP